MDELLAQYVEQVKRKQLSSNTLDAYIRDINRFLNFLKSRDENIQTADTVTIMAYSQYLIKGGRANTSVVRNIVSVRNFYKFLIRRNLVEYDPTINYEIPKVHRNVPKILTIEEVDKFLFQPDLNTHKGIRDKAMLEIMYATGIKVTELLNLTVYDINLKLSYIKSSSEKTKERIIPIGSCAVKYLGEYLEIRQNLNPLNFNLLFLNSKGNKMTRQGFWKIVKAYAEEANINKNMNSYTLRHSFAVHLIQNGADIKSVQELLGHNNMSATQIYSGISKKSKLAEVYKKTHPRA